MKTSDFSNDISRELDEIRAAAQASGLRILQEMELDWVGGGGDGPSWDNTTPPPP